MREQQHQPKIGAGALAAAGRQGLKELAQIVPAFPDSVRAVEEPGQIGNPTPQEVFSSKKGVTPGKTLDLDMDK